jgi:hypothetical protein
LHAGRQALQIKPGVLTHNHLKIQRPQHLPDRSRPPAQAIAPERPQGCSEMATLFARSHWRYATVAA